MDIEKKLKTLQMFYAGVLADSVLHLGNEGVLEKVTEKKKMETMATGKIKAQQLGVQSTQQVFELLPEIFGCSNWKAEKNETGFCAEATSCMLCAMAKRLGTQSPCKIYCLDSMEGLVKGVNPGAGYQVESTLWESGKCRVTVTEK